MKEKDQELYQDFLNGNEKAFEELMTKYKNNMVYFISKYVKNLEIAEDIFQETMIYLLEHKEKYDNKYALKTYLYMIAKSKAIDYLRSNSKIENIDDYEKIEDIRLLEEIIISKERLQKISKVISEMSLEYQIVIYLTKIEELSYQETAIIMKKSERQIKTLAYYAKKKLRGLLIKEGVIEMKKNRVIKVVSIVLVIGVCMSGVALATNYLINKFGHNASDGIQIAVDNGYVGQVNTEYKDSNGIGISINSFLIDDANFDISFDVKFDSHYKIEDMLKMDIMDLKVVNENNEKIFATCELEAEEMKTLYKTEQEARANYDSYQGGYGNNCEKINNNEIRFYLTATGNPRNFPESKVLKVTFHKIRITNWVERKEEFEYTIYEGNWDYTIDVPSEMSRSNIVKYNAVSISDENYKFEEAKLSNTAFKIYLSNCNEITWNDNECVETSDGRKFYPARRSDGDGEISVLGDGIVRYYNTFNLTTYDATEKLKVHVFKRNGDEVIIELVKEK